LAVIDENEFSLQPIKYVKGDLIGSGEYGRVYEALDMNGGKLFAIKTI
jgi:serine/threonine protein kinase